ncbi:ATP-binding protein [uncultured Roseobacter sp.]|uniref:sensor histidine kinase n=1 Tax=uncultured Roseobacter sp. TaxID=114847 RepID=UPI0026320A93|nr:ATP-binding protein [uncultured Roseobacter sp.]
MKRHVVQRFAMISVFLLAVAALSAGVWRYGYLQALDQLARQGRGDLALASDRLVGQLQRYRELAVLLADHPVMALLEQGDGTGEASALFLSVADKTAALDVMYVDQQGRVLAAAHSAPGADLSAAPYIRRAQQGALGWGHGIGTPLPARAYYYAAPAFGADGRVTGSVVVAVSISSIEDAWRGGFRSVFFTDAAGAVFVSNRTDLVGWTRAPDGPGLQPDDGSALPFDSYETGGHEVWQVGWGPYLPENALHLTKELPVIGLTGEVLLDVSPARRLAALQAAALAALCLAFGAFLFLATERRRTLSLANTALEERVARRTAALSDINAALRAEAAEREEAQAALARAQDDLARASRLSALGQMSAGISHELNQPLMAIRSFAENAVLFMERGQAERASENLTRISDMARRMGRIIKNLRAFSKQQTEPVTRVDVVAALETALEMTGPRLRDMQVEVVFDRPPGPVWAQGGEVRLVQVFVNLVSNALDAMKEIPDRRLEIGITPGTTLCIALRDFGPGIAEPEKVFDPFYSTKEVGASEGMGLGLSISYGIIQSFGGDIRVSNSAPGALFVVEINPWQEQEAA